MAFHRFVALRYLLGALEREEGRRFLRFITFVAVGGVAIGVAALLLALAIVRGFSNEIEAKIVGFGAHVQVESIRHAPLDDANEMLLGIRDLEGVSHAVPVIVEFALLRQAEARIDGVSLWGIDSLPTYIENNITAGSARLEGDDSGNLGAVIGASLAQQMDISLGERITIFSTRNVELEPAARPRVKQFVVTGIYETSLADFDATYVFADLEAARQLFDYGQDEVTRLDLTLKDVAEATTLSRHIEETYGFPVMARTIFEIYRGLFAWVELQEAIIPIVIGILVLVAAFNIVGTLLMIILEKTREIGIFASMGASRKTLKRLFLWLGILVGGVGTITGSALALGFALLQQRYDIIPLPADAYYMSTAPITIDPLDFFLVAVVSLTLCTLAAYIPARIAARIEPVRVIRFG